MREISAIAWCFLAHSDGPRRPLHPSKRSRERSVGTLLFSSLQNEEEIREVQQGSKRKSKDPSRVTDLQAPHNLDQSFLGSGVFRKEGGGPVQLL